LLRKADLEGETHLGTAALGQADGAVDVLLLLLEVACALQIAHKTASSRDVTYLGIERHVCVSLSHMTLNVCVFVCMCHVMGKNAYDGINLILSSASERCRGRKG